MFYKLIFGLFTFNSIVKRRELGGFVKGDAEVQMFKTVTSFSWWIFLSLYCYTTIEYCNVLNILSTMNYKGQLNLKP